MTPQREAWLSKAEAGLRAAFESRGFQVICSGNRDVPPFWSDENQTMRDDLSQAWVWVAFPRPEQAAIFATHAAIDALTPIEPLIATLLEKKGLA